MSDKEVLKLYYSLDSKGDSSDEEMPPVSCRFILEHVIREEDYIKWFTLLGTDIETEQKRLLPIRNNVVDEYVNENWPNHVPGSYVDQWDLYEELAANRVPMLWQENKERYVVPVKCLSSKKWKKLNWHMNNRGNCYEPKKMTAEQAARRRILVFID